ncbi:MAG: hypothetical protein FJ150_10525 [Euryarchaeota archaeon]|nr:hypothetical protein [Euryarchaeota archaeon]
MRNLKLIVLFIIVIAGLKVPVSGHGVHVTNESTIIIADNSTGKLAKKVVDEMGVNVTVYKFGSDDAVSHELEHALTSPNKKILAVAYQGTVKEFLSKHPELSNRILVCSADENAIKSSLIRLTATRFTGGFLTPLLSGLLIGVLLGLAVGAVWMKRKMT